MCGWGGIGSSAKYFYTQAQVVWWLKYENFSPTVLQDGLAAGESIEERDSRGYTPLIWASIKNKFDVVLLLLKARVDIDAVDNFGQTALYFSTINQNIEIVAILERHGADLKQREKANKLLEINRQREFDIAQKIGFTIGGYGFDLAAIATALNSGEFIDFRQIIEQQDSRGYTPLIWSAINNNFDMVLLLLQHGAEVDAIDKYKQTALYFATIRRYDRIVEVLEKFGANQEQKARAKSILKNIKESDSEPFNVRRLRCGWEQGCDEFSHNEILSCLEIGLSVNTVDSRGRSPLIRSAIRGDIISAAFFINAGAEINLLDNSRQTALYYACINHHSSVVELLELHGADKSQLIAAELLILRTR